MLKAFTDHPRTVGESYLEHLRMAWGFAGGMALGALCCFVHGLLPFALTTSGSRRIGELHERMISRRAPLRAGPALPTSSQARRAAGLRTQSGQWDYSI